jgi:dihydropteroate synthase
MIAPRPSFTVPLAGGAALVLGERTLVMGILNVTPDSFADGGAFETAEQAVAHGRRLVDQGADLIDIGGESTRPGAQPISEADELARVLPVVRGLAKTVPVPLSIDTTKAAVARAALDEGAAIVNDVSALQRDPAIGRLAAERGAGLVLMHTRGTSADMYALAAYDDVPRDVAAELAEALARAAACGVDVEHVVLDPGLGFAKRAPASYATLAGLDHPALVALGRPLLVGPSRKSFLRAALGDVPPGQRDWGTAAAVTAAILAGAHIVRVHTVAAMVQVARVADMIRSTPRGDARA